MKCDICGTTEKETKIINSARFNKFLCRKHYLQLYNNGKIGRSIRDKNEVLINEDYAEIVLYNRKNQEVGRTKIDKDDIDKATKYKWYLDKNGYVVCKNNKVFLLLHRYLTNCPEKMTVDHEDHDTLNNMKSNLRICSNSQNNMNKSNRKDNKSGLRGVSYSKRDKCWISSINVNKQRIVLGYFKDKQEAFSARLEAEKKYFNEFAYKGND